MILRIAAALIVISFLSTSGYASDHQEDESTIVLVTGVGDNSIVDQIKVVTDKYGYRLIRLPEEMVPLSKHILLEIDDGRIYEKGTKSPPSLKKFSKLAASVLGDKPKYRYIYSIAPFIVPLDLVRRGDQFWGDSSVISHIFFDKGEHFAGRLENSLAPITFKFTSYVVDLIFPMPSGVSRIKQDVVRSALSFEKLIPVQLLLNSSSATTINTLKRNDISILHLDTHGGERGTSVQIDRKGYMLGIDGLPNKINIPVVLLFGCEGVATKASIGVVMNKRGVMTVISAFAKFVSLGITGRAISEQKTYQAFLGSIVKGKDVGTAVLNFRRTAKEALDKTGRTRPLTRLFFVIVGNSRLKFSFE
jgi:hypothetical protein